MSRSVLLALFAAVLLGLSCRQTGETRQSPAKSATAGAQQPANETFCKTDDGQHRECRADPALQAQLTSAETLFRSRKYQDASRAYADAFRDTPFRPVEGSAHGLMIASLAETGQYEAAMEEVLRRDRLLARDDYKLWSDLAIVARRMATKTSVEAAQASLDKAFQRFPSKLKSRVWPLIPEGSIGLLRDHKYRVEMVYKRDTENQKVRRDIERFVAANPSEPFVELAYLSIGQFDQALAASPKSIIGDVLHYAKAYEAIAELAEESRTYASDHPEAGDNRPLGSVLRGFRDRATAVRPHLEAVLHEAPQSPHADDSAFWLGWLAFQQGQETDALNYFAQAMEVGNGDYATPAVRWSLRLIGKQSPPAQLAIVSSTRGMLQSPLAWYFVSRSAYRAFDYKLAMETAERGLTQLNIPPGKLPATTAPATIRTAIEMILRPNAKAKKPRVDSKDSDDPADAADNWVFVDPNLAELPYIVQASKEIAQFLSSLNSAPTEPPAALAKRVRAFVTRYSTPTDHGDSLPANQPQTPAAVHADYRQAIHMIDASLQKIPARPANAALREWLYYRKVRLLVDFDAGNVAAAVAQMEGEFPSGDLMDDALAEQLFVEVAVSRNLEAARVTFGKITSRFANGNALDNAHNWMAVALYCGGRVDEAKAMDREIIQRFPVTRHAYYAVVRLMKTPRADCSDGIYTTDGPIYRTRQKAAVYAAASRQNPVLLSVNPGTRLAITAKKGDWYTVHFGRTTGYVSKDDVQCQSNCWSDREENNQK